MNPEELRELAKRAIADEVMRGEEAQEMLALMTGPEAWRFGAAITLAYLERAHRGDVENAKAVLVDMLEGDDG